MKVKKFINLMKYRGHPSITSLFQAFESENENGVEDVSKYPAQPPPPVPPSFAKTEIYRDPKEFAEVDRRAINVAQEDQKTFTDLVSLVHSNVL